MRLRVWLVVVFASVSANGSRRAKIDEKRFLPQRPVHVKEADPHIIYPRTGRLFHADYVRDNEIFKSLERTNFMRRGPFARGFLLAKTKKDENDKKKSVRMSLGRMQEVSTKKSTLNFEKDVPSKAILIKISKAPTKRITNQRSKREIDPEQDTILLLNKTTSTGESNSLTNMEKINIIHSHMDERTDLSKDIRKSIKESNTEIVANNSIIKPEKIVEEDSFPHVQNNDTDKTLFVHDSINHEETRSSVVPSIEWQKKVPQLMKKTVVDDSLNLYPVYRGIKYYYPFNERRLIFSPQLSVQLDLPVVTDYLPTHDNNSTTSVVGEGRSRRPLKKLAFPLLLALKLKTAILLPLILGLISLISFKGLWSGLTALGIAAALGLKALVAGSGPKVVVQPSLPPPSPHVHHFGPHEYAEIWNRRGDDFNDYRPPNTWT